MSTDRLSQWLEKLGYTAEADALHRVGDTVPARHPYALEMQALLRPDGAIRAEAVFDVEGVPTVVFVGERDGQPLTPTELDGVRQRLWNQNLVSVVIVIEGSRAKAMPVRRVKQAEQALQLTSAKPDGVFSAAEVRSSDLSQRLPKWFDVKTRVDRKLLDNLTEAVRQLRATGLPRRLAQVLVGQIMFIGYLEHRQIVSDIYRARRDVGSLHALVRAIDRDGVKALIDQLRKDFNGDFLARRDEFGRIVSAEEDTNDPWRNLSDDGYRLLDRLLSRMDLAGGQGDFWSYDFSFIPVELLSGLYESFLSSDEQAADGAYYTPRHLATLAVDQVFDESPDPLSETIFDGACGSGILLTTAYRKLIALTEAKVGRQIGFAERRALLLDRIFGGDTNPMAIRVTAFSLYLSLLEGLDPTDILEAQERDGVKLPDLRGSNLCGGASADIFSDEHPFFGKRFSLAISNPPWKETSGAPTSADEYAYVAKAPFVLRQVAGLYSVRALDFLTEGGRLCLILPITLFLGSTSQRFVPYLFNRIRPLRLINFGDLQQLLFPSAENTCNVLVATRRPREQLSKVTFTETFDYCVPKADLSLTFGRLTLQSADRHELQTQAVQEDTQLLVAYMWGDAHDLSILTRLAMRGTFRDFWAPAKTARWVNRKGIHFEDASREPVSAAPLRNRPFVSVDALRRGIPVLHADTLSQWPKEQPTVVGLSDAMMRVFDGPRVLYPDGFSKSEPNVRAVFVNGRMSFNSSVGVIAGPVEDEDLLRFAAIYLRSSLARYFLMLTCAKMLSERNGVHLENIEPFPFFAPEDAADPMVARATLERVSHLTRELEQLPELLQLNAYEQDREALDELVFDYFGLDSVERSLVRESVSVLLPSIRPRSYKSLYTLVQQPAAREAMDRYAQTLGDALSSWRDRMGGAGHFHVEVVATDPSRTGAVGIVRVQYLPKGTSSSDVITCIDDAVVQETLRALRRDGLDKLKENTDMSLLPDRHLWTPRGLYLVRPLIQRSWLIRTALRDAERIVRDVQRHANPVDSVAA